MLYRERLWPTPGVWAMAVLFPAGVGVTMIPLGLTAVLIAFVVTLAAAVAAFVHLAATINVTTSQLIAGRAQVECQLLGRATAHGADDARFERGPGLDARAFLLLRGWLPGVVKVTLDDPADPTPYWLISTRQPMRLAAAINEARARP